MTFQEIRDAIQSLRDIELHGRPRGSRAKILNIVAALAERLEALENGESAADPTPETPKPGPELFPHDAHCRCRSCE